MPIYVKSVDTICSERALDDSKFYYDDFRNHLLDRILQSDESEARIELARLDRWLISYRIFSEKYHKENYVKWNDIYVNEEDAQRFSSSMERPRAPFIGLFEDI
jgi:hypothetical protein